MPGKLLTTSDVAERLGVSRQTAHSYLSQGLIPAQRTPGGQYRVAEAEFEGFLRRRHPTRRTTVLAIANQKGGAAKTTTAVALAAALVDAQRRVLLIDCDPQANATDAVGFDRSGDYTSLYHAMRAYLAGGPAELTVFPIEPGWDLAPSHLHLASMETEIVMRAVNKATVLRALLDSLTERYDWILLDCAPSLGWLTINALTAADQVLIPQIPDFISAQGLGQLAETVEMVRTRIKDAHRGETLEMAGVVLTRVRAHVDHHQQMRAQIAAFCDTAGIPFLSARSETEQQADRPDQVEIPDTIGAADAAGQAIPLSRFPAGGAARLAYRKLASLLLAPANMMEEPTHVR
jgi:chromosome partitioning protein